MKKIALVLAVLLCVLPMMAFAQVAVTGSVSFEIGDSNETDPALPAFSAAKSATATVAIASDDEKVVATVGLDLLPAATSTFAYGDNNQYDPDAATGYANSLVVGYAKYLELEAIVDFWNDHNEDETAVKEVAAYDATTATTALFLAAINAASTDDIAYVNDDGDLDVKSAEKKVATALTAADLKTKFTFDDTAAAEMNGIVNAAYAWLNAETAKAINKILQEATDTTIKAVVETVAVNEVKAYVDAIQPEDYAAWTADDKSVVKAAYDLEKALYAVTTPANGDPTVTTAISYITSASLAFKDVFGVLDVTFNLAGTHVAAGAISVDGAGHTDDAVSGYQSLAVGLSSGVVEGLNAGFTFFIDANDMGDNVDDDFYTWLDETDDTDEPKYGLGINGGYTMATDDMTVGASVALGVYDLLGGDDLAWAFSIAPMFSGFGANVDVQFDYGMDMMYFMIGADYTIMGITPNVAFYYINETGDNVLSYSSSPASVMAKFKDGNDAGMLLSGGLNADLSELVGMGVSVYGGADYGLSGDAAKALAWNAGLSVAGLVDGLTVGFDCDADSVEGSTFDYAVSASYAYSIATLSLSVGSDYNSDDEKNYTAWSVGTSVSF